MDAVFPIQTSPEDLVSMNVIAFLVSLELSVKLTLTNVNPILVYEVTTLLAIIAHWCI